MWRTAQQFPLGYALPGADANARDTHICRMLTVVLQALVLHDRDRGRRTDAPGPIREHLSKSMRRKRQPISALIDRLVHSAPAKHKRASGGLTHNALLLMIMHTEEGDVTRPITYRATPPNGVRSCRAAGALASSLGFGTCRPPAPPTAPIPPDRRTTVST
jgi:hypothetical protein